MGCLIVNLRCLLCILPVEGEFAHSRAAIGEEHCFLCDVLLLHFSAANVLLLFETRCIFSYGFLGSIVDEGRSELR